MKAIKTSFLIILGVILLLYIGGVFLFSKYFLPSTTINGHDFSLMRIDELEKNYNEISNSYKIEIAGREEKEKILGKDIDYSDKLEGDDIFQNPFYWFISMLVPKNIEAKHTVYFNEHLLNEKIHELKQVKNMKPPVDASIDYVGDKFMIVKEDMGTTFSIDEFEKLLNKKILAGETEFNIEENKLYMDPEIYENNEDLIKARDNYNKVAGNEIVVEIGSKEEKLSGTELASMYDFNGQEIVPNQDKALQFARMLSRKYDTYKTDRTFYATGLGLTVVKGGIYGWLTDVDKTKDLIVESLSSMESKHIEPVYKLTAMSRDGSDLGKNYIEIDLGRQHMWYYEEGKLAIETDVVTGNPSKENGTPTGTGRVWSREKDRYLTGETYQSHVDYWMPFNWSGCGVHDSKWRTEYGGKIYLTRGSHGCVNTPPEIMKDLFAKVKVGTPVIVYDSSDLTFTTIK